MKKIFCVAVAIFLYKMAFCQSQTPSTVGQIYNLEVGDTFQYHWVLMEGEGCDFSGDQMVVITSKRTSSDSIVYGFTYNSEIAFIYCAGDECSGCYGIPFPDTADVIYSLVLTYDNKLIIVTEDSSIFSGYYHYSGIDTIFSNSLYNGRKQDEFASDFVNDIYAEGVGLVNRTVFYEGENATFYQEIVYYHKATGEIWGTPLADTLFTGVNNLVNNLAQLKIFPNPVANTITVDYNFADWDVGIVSLVIVNELGQVVYSQPVPEYSGYQRIDVSRYASGIYMVYIKQDGQVVAAQKFAR